MRGRLKRDLTLTPWANIGGPSGEVTFPAGMDCHTVGDGWVITSEAEIARLTLNAHDAKYRYVWVPADAVAPEGVGWIEALKALGWQVELRGDLYAALAPHAGYNALLGYPTEGDAWAAARGYHNRLHGRAERL